MTAVSCPGGARSDGSGSSAVGGPDQRTLSPTAGRVLAARRHAGWSVMFHGGRDWGKTLDISLGLRRGIVVRCFSRNGSA